MMTRRFFCATFAGLCGLLHVKPARAEPLGTPVLGGILPDTGRSPTVNERGIDELLDGGLPDGGAYDTYREGYFGINRDALDGRVRLPYPGAPPEG